MGRITEFEVFCGLGLNFVVIAVVAMIGAFAYSI